MLAEVSEAWSDLMLECMDWFSLESEAEYDKYWKRDWKEYKWSIPELTVEVLTIHSTAKEDGNNLYSQKCM